MMVDRNNRAHHGNGLQQGGEEQREIGKPRMRRDQRNPWIEEGSHELPAVLPSGFGAGSV